MKIDKSFTIDAPQDSVWQFVSDPEKVGLCFPGCQEIEALGDDKYKASIKVQMGPIRTVFKVYFEVTEQRPPDYAAYSSRGEEENRASRMKAESTLTLSPLDENRTRVRYTSDVSIVGRLGKFGLNVMKNKADSMGDEFIQALRSRIEGGPDVPAAGNRGSSAVKRFAAAAVGAAAVVLFFYFLTR
jgi:uncharacterized protein